MSFPGQSSTSQRLPARRFPMPFSLVLLLVIALGLAAVADAQPTPSSGGDATSANNPLEQKVTVFIQDYVSPSVNRVNEQAGNDFEVRGLIPFKLFDAPQVLRFTQPLQTNPLLPGGSTTGLGNLTIFNWSLLETKLATFGAGPLLVVPTAGNSQLGSGKLQGGAAGIVSASRPWGLLASVATYQHSFGIAQDRRATSLLTFQPILIYNLPDKYYLRSSGVMSFDFARRNNVVPIGFGGGRVWDVASGVTLNTFFEPQYSVVRSGVGVPKFQVYTGINLQFSM